ncbi:MAG: hypothetical protein A2Z34_11675 [Planctomycetes bacterium RBG_16_59_8]|nr:MAG: hypothetical protein A2Z34_11675 [Planctomycetes bacterium RBG_16_59_8]
MPRLDIEKREALLGELATAVGRDRFESWFQRIEFVQTGDNSFQVPVPNIFYQQFAEKEFRKPIEDAFDKVFGEVPEIVFSVSDVPWENRHPEPPVTPLPQIPRAVVPQRRSNLRLNIDYLFDNLVVGPSNRLAHAAAKQVSERPGEVYNPLFLHGASGLGKTHLLQAICHELLRRHPHLNVVYISAESFVNEYISALQNRTIDAFRNRSRNVDVLLVDDIHFLNDKEGSKQELFHTFNDLHVVRKQMIFSSDAAPKDIPNLEERLVSRFQCGFVAGVESPTYEMRLAILHRKAEARKINLPEEVAHYVAANIQSNVRELEGAFNKLTALSSLAHKEIDLDLVREIIRESVNHAPVTLTVQEIQKAVCRYYGVPLADIQSKTSSKRISGARQVGVYLARMLTDNSLKELGGAFGGRDHATIMYYISRIEKQLLTHMRLKQDIDALTRQLSGRNL